MVINPNQIDNVNRSNQNEQSDSSAIAQELRKIADLQKMDQKSSDKTADELKSHAKRVDELRKDEKAFESKLQKDQGTKVLSGLAKDLAAMGIDLAKGLSKSGTSKLADELEQQSNVRLLKEDRSEIKSNLTKEAVKRSQGKQDQEQERDEKDQLKQKLNATDVKDAVQDYSGAFASYTVTASPDAKDKLEDARDRLRKKGFSDGDIKNLDRAVKRQFGREFLSGIQDSFIQHMFSPKNSFDFAVTGSKLKNSWDQATANPELSGVQADKESVGREMGRIAESSFAEIKDFVRDAVESKLMERHISGIDNRNEVKNLVNLGNKVGFDFNSFLKTWQQKRFDLGLFVMEIEQPGTPESRGQIAIGNIGAGNVGERHGYEMTRDEERELIINQLRAELMKQALSGDPFSALSFSPKIRKLKNGLIKLGLEMDDLSRVEKEAKALACFRTVEMLRDAFIERATYYDLSGASYLLLNNKIKGLVSNLDRLGLPLNKEALDIVRDDANLRMYDNTILELKSAMAVLENGPNKRLEEKIPKMLKLIERLKAESGFSHELGEELDQVVLRLKNIKESA